MKSNRTLGYDRIALVGNYEVGRKSEEKYRAYGYEWDSNQDASREMAHHEVCGRGATADEAIDKMVEAAIISGRTTEHVHNMAKVTGLTRDEAETLRRELKEAVEELADA